MELNVSDLKAELLKDVGPAKVVEGGKSDHIKALESIKTELTGLGKYFDQSLKNNTRVVERIVKAYQSSIKGTSTDSSGSSKGSKQATPETFGNKITEVLGKILQGNEKTSKDIADTSKWMTLLTREGTKQTGGGCLHVDVDKFLDKRLYARLDLINKSILSVRNAILNPHQEKAKIAAAAAASAAKPPKPPKTTKTTVAADDGDDDLKKTKKPSKWVAAASGVHDAKSGFGANALALTVRASAAIRDNFSEMDILSKLFEGSIKHNLNYMVDMRQTLYETTGLTNDQYQLQRDMSTLDDTSERTGKSREEMVKAMTTNMRRGFRIEEDTEKTRKTGVKTEKSIEESVKSVGKNMVSALHTSTMIGSEVGATAEMFHGWNVRLGMSSMQTSEMGRGLQQIAATTHVTGDHLLQIAKSSEQFLNTIRGAGTLTADVAKNIIGMRATADKLGVGELNDELLGASSSMKNFYSASQQTQALLSIMGSSTGNLENTTMGLASHSRDSMKKSAKGMEEAFRQATGHTMKEFDNLTDKQKELASFKTQNAFGDKATATAMMRQVDVYKENAKSYLDVMAEIRDQKGKGGSDEKAATTKENKYVTQAGMGYMTQLSEIMDKSGISFEAAYTKMRTSASADEKANLDAFTSGFGNSAQGVAEKMSQSLVAAKGKDFTKELADAFNNSDPKKQQDVIEAMTTEMQKLGITNKASQDPLSELAQRVKALNDWIGKIIAPYMPEIAGGFAIFAALIGGVGSIANMILTAANIWLTIASLKQFGGAGSAIEGLTGKLGGLGSKLAIAGVLIAGAATAWKMGCDAWDAWHNAEKEGYGKSETGAALAGGLTGDLKTTDEGGSSVGGAGLGGAWKGAAVGAAIGSLIPVVGTLVGGAIGLAVGGVASMYAQNWKNTREKDYIPKERGAGVASGFAEGTDEVLQTGKAIIHKGEKVVPEAVAKKGFTEPNSLEIEKAIDKLNAIIIDNFKKLLFKVNAIFMLNKKLNELTLRNGIFLFSNPQSPLPQAETSEVKIDKVIVEKTEKQDLGDKASDVLKKPDSNGVKKFATGTPEILTEGSAFVHPGEMIATAKQAQQIKGISEISDVKKAIDTEVPDVKKAIDSMNESIKIMNKTSDKNAQEALKVSKESKSISEEAKNFQAKMAGLERWGGNAPEEKKAIKPEIIDVDINGKIIPKVTPEELPQKLKGDNNTIEGPAYLHDDEMVLDKGQANQVRNKGFTNKNIGDAISGYEEKKNVQRDTAPEGAYLKTEHHDEKWGYGKDDGVHNWTKYEVKRDEKWSTVTDLEIIKKIDAIEQKNHKERIEHKKQNELLKSEKKMLSNNPAIAGQSQSSMLAGGGNNKAIIPKAKDTNETVFGETNEEAYSKQQKAIEVPEITKPKPSVSDTSLDVGNIPSLVPNHGNPLPILTPVATNVPDVQKLDTGSGTLAEEMSREEKIARDMKALLYRQMKYGDLNHRSQKSIDAEIAKWNDKINEEVQKRRGQGAGLTPAAAGLTPAAAGLTPAAGVGRGPGLDWRDDDIKNKDKNIASAVGAGLTPPAAKSTDFLPETTTKFMNAQGVFKHPGWTPKRNNLENKKIQEAIRLHNEKSLINDLYSKNSRKRVEITDSNPLLDNKDKNKNKEVLPKDSNGNDMVENDYVAARERYDILMQWAESNKDKIKPEIRKKVKDSIGENFKRWGENTNWMDRGYWTPERWPIDLTDQLGGAGTLNMPSVGEKTGLTTTDVESLGGLMIRNGRSYLNEWPIRAANPGKYQEALFKQWQQGPGGGAAANYSMIDKLSADQVYNTMDPMKAFRNRIQHAGDVTNTRRSMVDPILAGMENDGVENKDIQKTLNPNQLYPEVLKDYNASEETINPNTGGASQGVHLYNAERMLKLFKSYIAKEPNLSINDAIERGVLEMKEPYDPGFFGANRYNKHKKYVGWFQGWEETEDDQLEDDVRRAIGAKLFGREFETIKDKDDITQSVYTKQSETAKQSKPVDAFAEAAKVSINKNIDEWFNDYQAKLLTIADEKKWTQTSKSGTVTEEEVNPNDIMLNPKYQYASAWGTDVNSKIGTEGAYGDMNLSAQLKDMRSTAATRGRKWYGARADWVQDKISEQIFGSGVKWDKLVKPEIMNEHKFLLSLKGGAEETAFSKENEEINKITNSAKPKDLYGDKKSNDLYSYAVGTDSVPSTASALLHAGEMVIPASIAGVLRGFGIGIDNIAGIAGGAESSQQVTPLNRGVGSVQPVQLSSDVHERMQQDETSVQSGPTSIKSDELKKIEEYSKEQIAQIIQTNKYLMQLIAALSSSGKSGSGGHSNENESTSFDSFGSNDYGQWNTGQAAVHASKQLAYPI